MVDDYGAKLDQGRKGMEDMAKLHAAHYLELLAQGVGPKEAAIITAAYVRTCKRTKQN